MPDHEHMHDTPGMQMSSPAEDWQPSPHASSGTSWQPASVPGHLWMKSFGNWDVMAHGVIFLTYNQQGGPRGAGKAESVNWLMAMEQHRLGRGIPGFLNCSRPVRPITVSRWSTTSIPTMCSPSCQRHSLCPSPSMCRGCFMAGHRPNLPLGR